MTTVRKITVRNTKIPLELYVHIPFCVRKCQYCDFLSGPSDQKTRDDYVDALCREIRSISQKEVYEVVSIFIGGGTPSVLSGEQLCRIMDEIKQAFILSEDAEITMEANPGTVSPEQLKLCHEAGRPDVCNTGADLRELEAQSGNHRRTFTGAHFGLQSDHRGGNAFRTEETDPSNRR